jgi:hypothetical protein
MLNRIQYSALGLGQTWASSIIGSTEEIYRENIQGKVWWVPEHAVIESNETVDKSTMDGGVPENEEEPVSDEDRYTSLIHLWRYIIDAK